MLEIVLARKSNSSSYMKPCYKRFLPNKMRRRKKQLLHFWTEEGKTKKVSFGAQHFRKRAQKPVITVQQQYYSTSQHFSAAQS